MKTPQLSTEEVAWPDLPVHPSQNAITVSREHPHLNLDYDLVRGLVNQVLEGEQQKIHSLNIVLTHTERIRSLNQKYRNADYDTDVLSFSLGHGQAIEGEIYVNLNFARETCGEFGATFCQEACRYIVHGLLHLFGYEDSTQAAKKRMRGREDRYLQSAGITGI